MLENINNNIYTGTLLHREWFSVRPRKAIEKIKYLNECVTVIISKKRTKNLNYTSYRLKILKRKID